MQQLTLHNRQSERDIYEAVVSSTLPQLRKCIPPDADLGTSEFGMIQIIGGRIQQVARVRFSSGAGAYSARMKWSVWEEGKVVKAECQIEFELWSHETISLQLMLKDGIFVSEAIHVGSPTPNQPRQLACMAMA